MRAFFRGCSTIIVMPLVSWRTAIEAHTERGCPDPQGRENMKTLCVRRVRRILLLAPVALILSAAGAEALNPPPPPVTTCNSTGGGTICRAKFTTSFAFTAEFTCAQGFDIDEEGTTERQVVFTYDRAGNLTKRITRVTSLTGTFSNATTGNSVDESGHFTITHDYLTPGDLSTDQTSFDGVFAKVVLPGRGIILQDAGDFVFSPNGDVLREGGHHQFQNGELEELCEALA